MTCHFAPQAALFRLVAGDRARLGRAAALLLPLALWTAIGGGVFAMDIPLVNASFEEPLVDGVPPGWPATFGGFTFGSPEITLSDQRAYHGRYSIRIDDPYPDRGVGLRSAHVPAEPGALYVAAVQVYRESGAAQLYLEFWDSAENRIGVEIGSATRLQTWESLGVQGVAPPGTATLTLLLYSHGANQGVTYWDSAELAKIDAARVGYEGTRMGEEWLASLARIDIQATLQSGFTARTATHPRLYFTPEELDAIRQRIQGRDASTASVRSLANQLLLQARTFLNESSFTTSFYGGYRVTFPLPPRQPDPIPDPPGFTAGRYPYWTGMSRAIQTRLETLALAYAISGDAQFGERAKAYALALTDWEQWTDPTYPCGGSSCLDTAHLTLGVATVYDMVYDLLTDEERARIRTALLEKGLRPLYADTAQKSDHNLHMLRTSGLGAGALTLLGEVPDMERYISRAYENFFWYLDQRLDSGQTEGMNYTSYAMEYVARFADGLLRVTGNEDFLNHPYVHTVLPQWVAYFLDPARRGLVNFSDSNLNTQMSQTTMFLLARHRNHGLAGWYLLQATSVNHWLYVLYGGQPMAIQSPEQLGLPPSKAFWDIGWVALRSGWGRQDHLLAFHSSGSRLGHNQYDQNHFVLNVAGEWLITDPGYPDYSPGPKNLVTVHTIGHNALLVNGQGQLQKGSGQVVEFFHSGPFDYTVGEAGSGYLGHGVSSWERKILLSRPDYYVIVDRIAALRPVDLELLFHTGQGTRVTIGGAPRQIGERVRENSFRFARSLAAVDARVVTPQAVSLTYTHVEGATEYGPFIKVAPVEPVQEATFVTLLRPLAGSSARTPEGSWQVSAQHGEGEEKDVILIETPTAGGVEWILLNPTRRGGRLGAGLEGGRIQMVGDHAVVRRGPSGDAEAPAPLVAYHLANGTHLSSGGVMLVDTDHPVTIAVEDRGDVVVATVWSREPGRLSFRSGGAASVTVNGRLLDGSEYTYDGSSGLVTLALDAVESRLVIEK